MTQAKRYSEQYQDDATALLLLLDDMGLPADQDWDNESTTFIMPDDSRVMISGTSVEAL